MVQDTHDVVAIGNAIVDVLTHASDARLAELGLQKGAMTLIDSMEAETLYLKMGQGVACSGGSAANTAAGLARLGGKAVFLGKVKDDHSGQVFFEDMKSLDVYFPTKMLRAETGRATARCLVFVTPDGQRTMQTYLGACLDLKPDDIDPDLIASSKVLYLEGYLWDPPLGREAFKKAVKAAREAGRKVAFSLSDPFLVERHRDGLVDFLAKNVDILFANEDEITRFYQTDFEEAVRLAGNDFPLAALTRSEKGSVIVEKGCSPITVPAVPVDTVIDSTGAGDLYAAGFLYGLTHGKNAADSAHYGSVCAAEIITHVGARPLADLAALINSHA